MDDVLTADAEARRTAREEVDGVGERRGSDNVKVREEVKRVYEYI